jgi:Flp pilus assembly protein TadB
MNDGTPELELPCRHCGAWNHRGSSECWLCQRRDWRRPPGFPPGPTTRPTRGPLATIAGLMVLIALIALFLVVFIAVPPLAIVLLVFALPAWAVTEMSARRRRRRGRSMSGIEKALLIVGLTIGIPVVLAVALGIALFTFCALTQR